MPVCPCASRPSARPCPPWAACPWPKRAPDLHTRHNATPTRGPPLQDMYANWMFFRVTLDMLEMVFAKADPRVVKM